jgi:hypothetical protein
MESIVIIVFVSYAALVGYFVGRNLGMSKGQRESADAATSGNPPTWWKEALIDAEARKRKKDLEQSQ